MGVTQAWGGTRPACARPQARFLTFSSLCEKNNTSGPSVVMMMVVVAMIAVVIAGDQIVDDIGGELMLGSAPMEETLSSSQQVRWTLRARLQLRKKCPGLASLAAASQGFLKLPHQPFFICSLHLVDSSSSPSELSGEQSLGWPSLTRRGQDLGILSVSLLRAIQDFLAALHP